MSIFKKNKNVVLKNSSKIDDEYNYVDNLYKNTNNKALLTKLEELKSKQELHKSIINSLNNSDYFMYALGGLNLVYGDYHDKIDYLVITKNNLYTINLDDNKHYHEGILKIIGYKNKKVVDRIIFDQLFARYYQEINYLKTDKPIMDIIKEKDHETRSKFSRGEVKKMANNILKYHQEEIVYYDIIYKDYLDEFGNYITSEDNTEKLIKELKKWCYKIASKEKKTPKQILSDNLVKKIGEGKPKTLEELANIKGLSQDKITKYGKKIIDIVNKN